MTSIYIDRSLKKLIVELITTMGYTYSEFKDHCINFYKELDSDKTGREYIKKLKSPTVTWKTYLQTLKILGMSDGGEVTIGIEFNLPISSTDWSEPKTIWYKFTNFEHVVNDLSPSELSLFLSEILEESAVPQPIYINRIIEWMLRVNPNLDTHTVRVKAGGFIKKVAGDNVTWTTFLDALNALGIKDATYKINLTTKDGTNYNSNMIIIGDDDD